MMATETTAQSAAQPALRWQTVEVLDLIVETPRVKTLVLTRPDWAKYLPGQHVDVRLTAPDGYQAQRSYSIASSPEDKNLMLTVERIEDGEVSPYFTDEVGKGDKFELRGPIGRYFVWTSKLGGPLFLIGGGSGIVPLMSMLRHRAAQGSDVPARLLFSSRTQADIIYRAELDKLAEKNDGLTVLHTLTREKPAGWTARLGRIDADMLMQSGFAPGNDPKIFICGPTGFVEAAANALLATGHARTAIKTERFGPTGR
jgi:ferredoxin-NADP reductase